MDDKMLTTYDNPIDPFDNFELWWKTDLLLGHDCCGKLAEETFDSTAFSDEMNHQLCIEAMERIVSEDPIIYRIVSKNEKRNLI